MSYAELEELELFRVFRPAPPSNQGKWMTQTVGDAAEFGRRLCRRGDAAFHIVEIEVADGHLAEMYHDPWRDRVAPSWFADWGQLQWLQFVREVEHVPVRWSPGSLAPG